MFDLFFIFSTLFLRTESRCKVFYRAALRMQKIAADKVNIMECDPESTSVTAKFFPESNSVDYYALTVEFSEKSVVWKRLYKIIHQGVQENIVILNVTIFCFETKVFGNIKFVVQLLYLLCVKPQYFLSSSSVSKENTENFLKVPHECNS